MSKITHTTHDQAEVERHLKKLADLHPEATGLGAGLEYHAPSETFCWVVSGYVPRRSATHAKLSGATQIGGSGQNLWDAVASWRRNEKYHRTGELAPTLDEMRV